MYCRLISSKSAGPQSNSTCFLSAMYIVFLSVQGSPFNDPVEAIMSMFMMSLGEFGDYYESFSQTNQPILSKVGETTLCAGYIFRYSAVVINPELTGHSVSRWYARLICDLYLLLYFCSNLILTIISFSTVFLKSAFDNDLSTCHMYICKIMMTSKKRKY